MLTEIYIEALLADEELAEQVGEAWDAGGSQMNWRLWHGARFTPQE